jgi:hypothetical protein
MSREKSPLDKIKVAAACTADWRHMYGNERVRFCGQCSQNVYNLSALTREQAEDLILRHEGRLCVRFYRRNDGTVITNNCPVGLAALKAKYHTTKATIVKAALSFLAYLGVLWWVEGKPLVRPTVMGKVVAPDVPSKDVVSVTGMFVRDWPAAYRLVARSEAFVRQRAIYKVMPMAYVSAGKATGTDAVVKIVILPSGDVESATLIKGQESIREVAEGAALRWEFRPMTDNGTPVRVESTLTFHFGSLLPDRASRVPVRDQRGCEECL